MDSAPTMNDSLPDTTHEYYSISIQRYQTENPNGTGRRKILENKKQQCLAHSQKRADVAMRLLYKEIKKQMK